MNQKKQDDCKLRLGTTLLRTSLSSEVTTNFSCFQAL